jgi:TrmH family RNA methyltransferase
MPETLKITSRGNDRLVRGRKVRDGKVPDRIFIEGLRLCEEALKSPIELVEGFFTPSFARTERGKRLLDKVRERIISVAEISDDLFRTIADTAHSQGIALLARRPASDSAAFTESIASGKPLLFLYLYETNDPSNLGAVLRTSEAAGVSGVILSKGSADAFSSKALRAGMGANLRIPVWDRADANECIVWARGSGIRLLAADIKGKRSYTEIDWTLPSLVIFGSEAHGLDDNILETADEIVSIPMKNGVESLNLAASAGIILFEAVRQNSV